MNKTFFTFCFIVSMVHLWNPLLKALAYASRNQLLVSDKIVIQYSCTIVLSCTAINLYLYRKYNVEAIVRLSKLFLSLVLTLCGI